MFRRFHRAASATVLGCGFAIVLGHCGDGATESAPPIDLPERDFADDTGTPPADAPAPQCDRKRPFGTPRLVDGLDPTVFAATPRLSADELTIYFTTLIVDDGSLHADLVSAKRSSRDAPFGPATPLSAYNTNAQDNDPMIAADGLSLWFSSSRSGDNKIYVAKRASLGMDFGPATLVPNVGGPTNDMHPYYRAAATELWLTSDRIDGGSFDIFIARQEGGVFGAPTLVPELATPAVDVQPAITEDGLSVLLASNRDGGAGGFDLYIAERATTTESFTIPRPLGEINSASDEYAGWMTSDGCRIYFSSNRGTEAGATHRIHVAERSM